MQRENKNWLQRVDLKMNLFQNPGKLKLFNSEATRCFYQANNTSEKAAVIDLRRNQELREGQTKGNQDNELEN